MKYVSLVFCIIITSCMSSGEIILNNLKNDTTIEVSTNAQTAVSLILNIKGNVNDSFKLNNILLPGGKVDPILNLDWYNKTFYIKYEKYKASKENLVIKYKL